MAEGELVRGNGIYKREMEKYDAQVFFSHLLYFFFCFFFFARWIAIKYGRANERTMRWFHALFYPASACVRRRCRKERNKKVSHNPCGLAPNKNGCGTQPCVRTVETTRKWIVCLMYEYRMRMDNVFRQPTEIINKMSSIIIYLWSKYTSWSSSGRPWANVQTCRTTEQQNRVGHGRWLVGWFGPGNILFYLARFDFVRALHHCASSSSHWMSCCFSFSPSLPYLIKSSFKFVDMFIANKFIHITSPEEAIKVFGFLIKWVNKTMEVARLWENSYCCSIRCRAWAGAYGMVYTLPLPFSAFSIS